MKEYREVLDPVLHKAHASPYYVAFIAMVSAFAGINRRMGSSEPTDFIFDEQDGMQNKALRLYHRLKEFFPQRQFGGVAYRSDRDMFGLQAADLIAWQVRRFRCTPDEALRDELRRLHSSTRQPFKATRWKRDLEGLVTALLAGLPKLREAYGDERVDKFQRPPQTPAASFLSPYRKCLGSGGELWDLNSSLVLSYQRNEAETPCCRARLTHRDDATASVCRGQSRRL
jgi:hypothetical protein